jgi:hypothetical protein
MNHTEPGSRRFASEVAGIESESAEHDLHRRDAVRAPITARFRSNTMREENNMEIRTGRLHEGVLAIGLGMALASGGCGDPAPSTSEPVRQRDQNLKILRPYLALGDSVAFGYNPVDAQDDPKNVAAFIGYPELISLAAIPTANAACEGETSGSFIDVALPDQGSPDCRAWRAAGDAMHVHYLSSAQSQLQFAVAYLLSHPSTATVSIGIGGGDLLLVQQACEAAFDKNDPAYALKVAGCELQQVPTQLVQTAQNIGTIVGTIRGFGYTGQLVLVTYYAQQYADSNDAGLIATAALDRTMVAVAQAFPQWNLSIAKGFSSFGAVATLLGGGDSCKAGLLYKLPDGTCDIHPSRLGHSVLAAAVAGAVPASSIDINASTPQY